MGLTNFKAGSDLSDCIEYSHWIVWGGGNIHVENMNSTWSLCTWFRKKPYCICVWWEMGHVALHTPIALIYSYPGRSSEPWYGLIFVWRLLDVHFPLSPHALLLWNIVGSFSPQEICLRDILFMSHASGLYHQLCVLAAFYIACDFLTLKGTSRFLPIEQLWS